MSFILPLLPGEAAPKAAERYFDKEIVRMDKAKRKAIIAGNWKMNKTATEAAKLVDELIPAVKDASCEVVICTPYTDLVTAVEKTKGTNIHVGAENVHFEKSGAFTGEISADMLVDLGVEYVIVGHSERRQYFAETDQTVNKRALAALNAGLKVIICVGESLQQREEGVTEELVRMQTKIALRDVTAEQMANVVIAYEPIWAIRMISAVWRSSADLPDMLGPVIIIICCCLSSSITSLGMYSSPTGISVSITGWRP